MSGNARKCLSPRTPHAPHARALFRIHYKGYRVWSRLCWGHVLGGETPRDGASKWGALHPSRLSHAFEPRAWALDIFRASIYRHVRTTLAGHIRAAARPRHVRPDDTTTHTHHCTLRCTARSSTRSWLDCRAPTSMMHLRTKPGVIPSFLTVLRAEPRCRRPENTSIQPRRNEADSYRKWEQGGP